MTEPPRHAIAEGEPPPRASQAHRLVAQAVDRARSLDELVEQRPARDRAVQSLFSTGISACDLARIIADTNDRLAQRILRFIEAELGPPPLPYCWLGLGSAGRREQALKTDQDHALVYRDPCDAPAEAAGAYFTELAERAAAALERCGFPRCAGDVMATNPRWRQPLGVWRGHFARWVRQPKPEAVYNSEIFFDLRPIAGDRSLADALWKDLAEWVPHAPVFSQLLMEAALLHRPPLGFFDRFVVERSGQHRGAFHIKPRGLMPVVEAARAYALARGVTVTNTVERLGALRAQKAIPAREADDLLAAYEFLMRLRIRHHLEQLEAGEPLDDFIVPDGLSRPERNALKGHFKVIAALQAYIGRQVMAGMPG